MRRRIDALPMLFFGLVFLTKPGLWWDRAALAANFDLKPVKLFLEPQTKIEKLVVRNLGDAPLSLQIKAYEWTMDEGGSDRYSETRDLILFPKMLTLKKEEEKIIRVGTNLRPGAVEKAYRIFVEEIPTADPETFSGSVIRMHLKVGVPVFFQPSVREEKSEMPPVRLERGKVRVEVKNRGNVHLLVQSIRLKGEETPGREVYSQSTTGWYVLSGATKTYEIVVPQDLCRQIRRLQVEVKIQGNKILGDQFAVEGESCNRVL